MAAIQAHLASLKSGDGWRIRELARSRQEVGQLLREEFIARLTAAETANALGISVATVGREWRYIRAWLEIQLGRED